MSKPIAMFFNVCERVDVSYNYVVAGVLARKIKDLTKQEN